MQFTQETVFDQGVGNDFNLNVLSLRALFQVISLSCVFFAVMRLSPWLAIVGTVVFTPSAIRTIWMSELHRRNKLKFDFRNAVWCFCTSMSLVLLTMFVGCLAFAFTSLSFGLLAMIFGLAIANADYCIEAGIIGTVAGMIWGMAVAVIAVIYSGFKLLQIELPASGSSV